MENRENREYSIMRENNWFYLIWWIIFIINGWLWWKLGGKGLCLRVTLGIFYSSKNGGIYLNEKGNKMIHFSHVSVMIAWIKENPKRKWEISHSFNDGVGLKKFQMKMINCHPLMVGKCGV